MANEMQLWILKQGVPLWNTWQTTRNNEEVDLTGVNLDHVKLDYVDFSGVNLTGASLRGARLHNATFSETNLTAANLEGAIFLQAYFFETCLLEANLTDANFEGARLSSCDLRQANLNHADLRYTSFFDCDLKHADLERAMCVGTIFAEMDLSEVKGLENIWHEGPCVVGVDTLFKSKKRLPEIFLRGCGVPEILIENLPYMLENAIDLYSCFISYSHKDKAFAQRVFDTLQGRGIRCYLDEKQMTPGDDIYEEIHRGIRYYDKMLLCCSKSSLTSWWVDQEINKAFQKERDLMKERGEKVKVLVPLDLDGYLFREEYEGTKGDEIRSRVAAKFKGWKRSDAIFEREIERVIRALRTDGGKEPLPTPKL